MNHRRQFLKTAARGIALAAFPGNAAGCRSILSFSRKPGEFGLQLYTLRDILPKDPKAVLKQVSLLGYKHIESYEHDQLGMFWGMTPADFRKLMDDLDMKIISSHCRIDKEFERKAEQAAGIGMKFLVCPSLENENNMTLEVCKKTADLFNSKGTICQSKGLRFAYHNHEKTFIAGKDNLIPQQFFLENTDPSLVDYEMDIYWVSYAGQNPEIWLKKYPNRFKMMHVKDRNTKAPPSKRNAFSVLGKGSLDLPSILHAAKGSGTEYFFVEQDESNDIPVMEVIRKNADYMKNIRY